MEKRVKLVSVSSSNIEKSLIFRSQELINKTAVKDKFFFNGISNNQLSLATIYNHYLYDEESGQDADIIVFVHDDVFISDYGCFIDKCYESIQRYHVFGVAGGYGEVTIEPNKPSLWHLITQKRVGYVAHYVEQNYSIKNPYSPNFMTSFGITPHDATLLDGVFLGVCVRSAREYGLKFDENCPSRFHFYDLLFSVNARLKGLKVGVFPINIIHQSHGLKEYDNEFLEGEKYFRNYCASKSKKD